MDKGAHLLPLGPWMAASPGLGSWLGARANQPSLGGVLGGPTHRHCGLWSLTIQPPVYKNHQDLAKRLGVKAAQLSRGDFPEVPPTETEAIKGKAADIPPHRRGLKIQPILMFQNLVNLSFLVTMLFLNIHCSTLPLLQ